MSRLLNFRKLKTSPNFCTIKVFIIFRIVSCTFCHDTKFLSTRYNSTSIIGYERPVIKFFSYFQFFILRAKRVQDFRKLANCTPARVRVRKNLQI